MPALKIFSRKWLAATDDLPIPCTFELLWRCIVLIFASITLQRYWTFFEANVIISNSTDDNFLHNTTQDNETTISCLTSDVIFIKTYLIGLNAILLLNLPLLLIMIWCSARGSMTDIDSRRAVVPLVYFKLFLILPETVINTAGTVLAFSGVFNCINYADGFATTSIEVIVVFYWIIFGLIIFGIIIAYDPLGRTKYIRSRDGNDNIDDGSEHHAAIMHKKVSKLWLRRFKMAGSVFCCLHKDEYGKEAFTQISELFSNLFRGTDLVPSDIIAGSILLRVRQKKEHREYRRIQMLSDNMPRFSSDLSRVFTSSPPWMTIRNAQHYLRFAVSSYGWPMICAINPCGSFVGLMRKITCCACIRTKSDHVVDDNCCHCNLAGVKFASKVHTEDVIYASFKNQVFEIPFCILADHKTKSVVLSIRGSWSIRDIFTDLSANPCPFAAPGLPDDTVAHHGMAISSDQLIKSLYDENLLNKIMEHYPDYEFIITGHSLGAGIAILTGAKLRAHYPNLKVYAFATPGGLLSREAAKITEQFAFTVTVGDDFVSRLSVDSAENLKIGIIETLQSCKLPKYRVILNGCAYAIFGIPPRDLEKTWYDVTEITSQSNHSSTLLDPTLIATISNVSGVLNVQRPKRKLYIGGKVLHIVRKKKTEADKKSGASLYEMRWAWPDDFTEMKVMPRMILDHFPHNIFKVVTRILNDRKCDSILSLNKL